MEDWIEQQTEEHMDRQTVRVPGVLRRVCGHDTGWVRDAPMGLTQRLKRGRVSKQECTFRDQGRKERARGRTRGWWEKNVYEKLFLVVEVKGQGLQRSVTDGKQETHGEGVSPWPSLCSPHLCCALHQGWS